MALRDDPSLSLEDKQAKLLVIRHDLSERVMSVLSPEQQQRLIQALRQQEQDDEQQQTAPPQTPPQR